MFACKNTADQHSWQQNMRNLLSRVKTRIDHSIVTSDVIVSDVLALMNYFMSLNDTSLLIKPLLHLRGLSI